MAAGDTSGPVVISGRALIPLGVVVTLIAGVLAWAGVWAITAILDHQDRITRIESSRYTVADAKRDRERSEDQLSVRLARLEESIHRQFQRLERLIEGEQQ